MKRAILVIITILCFGIFAYNNTYAVEDVVYNIDSNSTFPFSICEPTGDVICSNYSFVKVEPTPAVTPSNANNSYFLLSGFYGTRVPTFTTSLFGIGQYTPSISVSSWNSNLSSLKITLTNSVNTTCPEPPAPDCPDPSENSQFINVVLDAFWKYHTVFAGAVASLIAIFVVYRIIKGMLR